MKYATILSVTALYLLLMGCAQSKSQSAEVHVVSPPVALHYDKSDNWSYTHEPIAILNNLDFRTKPDGQPIPKNAVWTRSVGSADANNLFVWFTRPVLRLERRPNEVTRRVLTVRAFDFSPIEGLNMLGVGNTVWHYLVFESLWNESPDGHYLAPRDLRSDSIVGGVAVNAVSHYVSRGAPASSGSAGEFRVPSWMERSFPGKVFPLRAEGEKWSKAAVVRDRGFRVPLRSIQIDTQEVDRVAIEALRDVLDMKRPLFAAK